MKKGLKITTIGGGSTYTPELIEGFIRRYDELPINEICLVDIEAGREKLEIVGNLARRMIEKAKLPITVTLTLDLEKALEGADFVTTQIRVGQLDARLIDEIIPLSHGIIGQETNGAGGLFNGLRTIPVILRIASIIHEICPNAWMINFSNPAGMITEALFKHSQHQKVIGVCNVPAGIEKQVAELLEVPRSRVRIDFAGLNHLVYGVNVYLDGEEIKEKVIQFMCEKHTGMTMKNIADLDWDSDFLKALNLLPCPYHRYYYKSKAMLENELKEYHNNEVRAEVVRKIEKNLLELYKNTDLSEKPKELEKRGGALYSDVACNLISSIYNNKCDIQVVDAKNNGTIKWLDDDSVIEISSVITKDGPKPLPLQLPDYTKGLVLQIKEFEKLAIEAAIEGDYHKGLLALAINPLVNDDETAKTVFDEMLIAHKSYLPNFFKKGN